MGLTWTDLALVARLLLTTVLIAAGFSKLRATTEFKSALRMFGIPEPLEQPLAVVTPLIEIAIGIGIAAGLAPLGFGLAALLLLTVFTVAVGYVLLRGASFRCSCFGSLASERISWLTLTRNGLLVAAAGLLVALSSPMLPNPVDELIPASLVVVTIVFCYVATVRALGLEMPATEQRSRENVRGVSVT